MNGMIQGDTGTNCFSPYHNSDKCKRCNEEEEPTPLDWWDNFNEELLNKINDEKNK